MRGFTVAELLVGLILAVVIAGLAGTIVRQLQSAWREKEQQLLVEQEGRSVLAQLGRELRSCYVTRRAEVLPVRGSAGALRTGSGDEVPADTIRFVSSLAFPRSDPPVASLGEVRYRVRQGPHGEILGLERSARHLYPTAPARWERTDLNERIVGIDVTYYDPDEEESQRWVEAWSGREGEVESVATVTLPSAVKVSVGVRAEADGPAVKTFSALIALNVH